MTASAAILVAFPREFLRDSPHSEVMNRSRRDHHCFRTWHQTVQDRTARVLPVPETRPPCHHSGVCVPQSPAPGPAARAEPQGRYQLLWAQPSLSIAASRSGTWPRGVGHQPSVKTGASRLLQQKQPG